MLIVKYIALNSYGVKYTEASPLYSYNSMNFMFETQIIRLIFGCISEAALLYLFGVIYSEKDFTGTEKARKRAASVARIMVSIGAVFVVLLVKIFINKTGMLSLIDSEKSYGYVGNASTTYNNSTSTKVYRFKSKDEMALCYEKTNVEITRQKNVLLSFDINTFCDHKTLNDYWSYKTDANSKNNISQAGAGNSIMIDNTEVIFYSNQYIAFVEDSEAKVIAFDEISNTDKSEALTKLLEKMIDYGYWDFFEYGRDYLLKYDSDFIEPYISRYSEGNFTENEKDINKDIRMSYIAELSKRN